MKGLFPFLLCMAYSVPIPVYAKAELLAIGYQTRIDRPHLLERFDDESAILTAQFAINPASVPKLCADVALDGDTLGAPFAKSLPFTASSQSEIPALLSGFFSIPLPAVEAPSVFRIVVRENFGEDPGSKEAVSEFLIRLYPRGYFRPMLVEACKDRDFVLVGSLPGLRDFLKNLGIKWADAGNVPPLSLPPKTILIGEFSADTPLPKLSKSSSLLAYRPSPLDLPGTLREIKDCAVSCIVNAAPPLTWQNNPSGQRLLLDLLYQTRP